MFIELLDAMFPAVAVPTTLPVHWPTAPVANPMS